MEISEEQYYNIKQKAIKFYKNNRIIFNPKFWEIKIDLKWFQHLEWKRKNHKRTKKEAYIRYLCFLQIKFILNKLWLYQEFREEEREKEIKRKWKKIKEKKIVYTYWFVWIVNNNKNRIKVVIEKVDWWNWYKFRTVIPVWNNNWYSKQIFFDNDKDFFNMMNIELEKDYLKK